MLVHQSSNFINAIVHMTYCMQGTFARAHFGRICPMSTPARASLLVELGGTHRQSSAH